MSVSDNFGFLPEIKVISLIPDLRETKPTISHRGRPALPSKTKDLRWPHVQEFLDRNNFSPNSRKVYERELKRFLHWTELQWSELRPRYINQYKTYLMEEVTTHQGKLLSKSSVNSAIAALRSFFDWLQQSYPDLLPNNPASSIKFEKVIVSSVQSLTSEQIGQIWSTLNLLDETKERDTVLLHLLSYGLWVREIVALTVADFDGEQLFLPNLKNTQSQSVLLRQESQQALQSYLVVREAQGEILAPDRPLLLSHHSSRKGERLSYHGVYFAIEKIGRLAGMTELHPQLFRRTYAT